MVKNGKENEQIVSILCYFLIGIVWYFIDKEIQKSELAKLHSKQALNLLIINFGVSALSGILSFAGLFFIVPIINLGILVLWILGLINAINEQKAKIPIIGDFADKYLTY